PVLSNCLARVKASDADRGCQKCGDARSAAKRLKTASRSAGTVELLRKESKIPTFAGPTVSRRVNSKHLAELPAATSARNRRLVLRRSLNSQPPKRKFLLGLRPR